MRPTLLLTNDDGVHAPGILTMYEALVEADFADLIIVAPASERSGAGVAITWDRPIHVQEVAWFDGCPAWAVDGTPADCVKMGERVVLKKKPDLIVSGINAGSNAGRNVLHSGTVGACVEGAFRGIPGIAFSCENGDEPNFHVAKKYIAKMTRYVLDHPLPVGTILNVNVPHAAKEEVRGIRWTCQGEGRWAENPYLHLDSPSGPTYYLGGKPEERDEGSAGDIALLREGYLTAVPLHVHDLTDKECLDERQEHFENFFDLLTK